MKAINRNSLKGLIWKTDLDQSFVLDSCLKANCNSFFYFRIDIIKINIKLKQLIKKSVIYFFKPRNKTKMFLHIKIKYNLKTKTGFLDTRILIS